MTYFLLNKNQEVAQFEARKTTLGGVSYQVTKQYPERMPIGFQNINAWLENRKGSKHNAHLRKLMMLCGCEKTEGFIRITHAATLNDTFWVKSADETVCWEDISFYRNAFDKTISRLAFEGIGLYGIQISSTSPELSTEGSFRKCWRREDDGIYLYKRGQEGARNVGLEPYCEELASELALKLCPGAVPYELAHLHGELTTKCPLFTNEAYGYMPYGKLQQPFTPEDMLNYYTSLGSEDAFRRMLVLDALIFNVDRHMGNHGILFNNDTLQPIAMAPVFDLNLSLLPYVESEEFRYIGDKMLDYGPRIGEDFTRIGQEAVTAEIRADLISLKGFRFSFRGDDRFSPERVKLLEHMIERQIEALLSKEILYTKDIFIPEHLQQMDGMEEMSDFPAQEEKAEAIWNRLAQDRSFSGYDILLELDHAELVLYTAQYAKTEMHINLDDESVWLEEHGIVHDKADCFLHRNEFLPLFHSIEQAIQQELHAKNR